MAFRSPIRVGAVGCGYAPERHQKCQDALKPLYDCGAAAIPALVELTLGQMVTCEAQGRNRHGRTLAICRPPSGLDVNAAFVRQGCAVAFRRYSDRYIVEEPRPGPSKRDFRQAHSSIRAATAPATG